VTVLGRELPLLDFYVHCDSHQSGLMVLKRNGWPTLSTRSELGWLSIPWVIIYDFDVFSIFKLQLRLYRDLKCLNETGSTLIWYSFVTLILLIFLDQVDHRMFSSPTFNVLHFTLRWTYPGPNFAIQFKSLNRNILCCLLLKNTRH